jgi:hypothetical protein
MRPVSVGLEPTANTLTTVYTVPTGYYANLVLAYIHNIGGSTKEITVVWNDASAASSHDILTAVSFTSKEYLTKFSKENYIVFEEGDKLQITTEAGSSFSFFATFEVFGETRV